MVTSTPIKRKWSFIITLPFNTHCMRMKKRVLIKFQILINTTLEVRGNEVERWLIQRKLKQGISFPIPFLDSFHVLHSIHYQVIRIGTLTINSRSNRCPSVSSKYFLATTIIWRGIPPLFTDESIWCKRDPFWLLGNNSMDGFNLWT